MGSGRGQPFRDLPFLGLAKERRAEKVEEGKGGFEALMLLEA